MFVCRGYLEGNSPCQATFTRSEHLARHVRKHTGERPFKCHCGRAFSRLDNVRQHAGTVHAEQAVRNHAMMANLVSLHNALSAAASASQQEAGMVLNIDPPVPKGRARSGSTSGSGEDKKPKLQKRGGKLSEPRSRVAQQFPPSPTNMAMSAPHSMQYMPSPHYQLPPQHYPSPNHPAYNAYPNPYGYMPTSTPPPGAPMYAQSNESQHSGAPLSSGPPRPKSRTTSVAPGSQRFYTHALAYGQSGPASGDGSPLPSTTPVPNSPSRITLPPISQLLPSPFARGSNGAQGPTDDQVSYVNGSVSQEAIGENGFISPSYSSAPLQGGSYQSLPHSASGYYVDAGYDQEQYVRTDESGDGSRYGVAPSYPVRSQSGSSINSLPASSFTGEGNSQSGNYSYVLPTPGSYGPGVPHQANAGFYSNGKPMYSIPMGYPLVNQLDGQYDEANGYGYAQTPRQFNPVHSRESSERMAQSNDHSQHIAHPSESGEYSTLPSISHGFDPYGPTHSLKRGGYLQQPGANDQSPPPAWEYPAYAPDQVSGTIGMSIPFGAHSRDDVNYSGRKRSRDEPEPINFKQYRTANGGVAGRV